MEYEMIIAVLVVSLTLLLGTVCSVLAQSDDIGSVLDKAQKSLSQNTEDNIEPVLESDYKSYEN
jgi:competence protein ComGC